MRVKQELSHFVSVWLLYIHRPVTYMYNPLLQSINLWNIFTRNDEHTDRYHCCYITIGYGKFTHHYTINAVCFAHDISSLTLMIFCTYLLSCQFCLWSWNCISYLYLSCVSSSAYRSQVLTYVTMSLQVYQLYLLELSMELLTMYMYSMTLTLILYMVMS